MESNSKPINTNFKVGIKVDLTGKNRSRGSPIPVEHEKRKQSGQIHRQILLQKRGKSLSAVLFQCYHLYKRPSVLCGHIQTTGPCNYYIYIYIYI